MTPRLAALASLLVLSGCGPLSDATPPPEKSRCPNDLPKECPTPAPSYDADVAPIVAKHCFPCHAPGGEEEQRPLDTYEHVYARRSSVLTQVYSCSMPPSGQAVPSSAERAVLLAWLVCGAPE